MEGEITETLLGNAENGKKQASLKDRIWRENKKMWVVAAPAIFTRFSTFGTGIITQAFLGHIGARELAAFALVFTVFLRFAQGILVHSLYPTLASFLYHGFVLEKVEKFDPIESELFV